MKNLRPLFRVFLFLFVLECLFRTSGWTAALWQDYQNKTNLDRKNEYRILCLGDSMTYDGGPDGYPRQLEQILNNRLGSAKVKVINTSIPGGDSSQTLAKLPQWLREYQPSMVIAMIGLSDEPFFVPGKHETFLSCWDKFFSKSKVYKLFVKLVVDSGTYFQNKYGSARSAADSSDDTLAVKESAPEWYVRLFMAAKIAEGKSDFSQAEKIYRQLANAPVDAQLKARMHRRLGDLYRKERKYKEYGALLREVLEINPGDFWAMTWVWKDCGDPKFLEQVLPVLRDLAVQKPEIPYFEELLGACTQEIGRKEEAEKHFAAARKLRESGVNPLTKKNYLELLKQLQGKDIQAVIMQYPRRPVRELESMLSGYPGHERIIFIDNEKIFEDALKTDVYTEYFKDRAGGNFGHLTKKGHGLLANHLADRTFHSLK